MKLTVVHRTSYDYADPVTTSHHLAHLAPRDEANQRCLQHVVDVTPQPQTLRERMDYFGNRMLYFGITEPHRTLDVIARSVVDLGPRPDLDLDASPAWENVADRLRTDRRRDVLDACQFTFDSPSVHTVADARDYARESFGPGRPILRATGDLMSRIFADFRYDAQATDTATGVDEVLRNRRGVCQDFAHVMSACLRSLGVACRYVSGYLLTRPPPGKRRLVGADASHAWVSVFVPDAGWFDFDPTNDVMPADEHITVGWGRDFSDVTPVRGVILGGGNHEISVSVDVAPFTIG